MIIAREWVRRGLAVSILLLALSWMIPAAMAQNSAPLPLTPNTTVTATLDQENIARVFIFVGLPGELANLVATSDTSLPLSLLILDSQGSVLAQVSDTEASGRSVATNVPLQQADTYFVMVFTAPGTEADASGEFRLTLTKGEEADSLDEASEVVAEVTEPVDEAETEPLLELTLEPTLEPAPEAEAPAVDAEGLLESDPVVLPPPAETGRVQYEEPEQILLANGIEVELSWNASVDLNLEVRDPFGNTLYWDVRTSPIGGSFGFDANGLCEVLTPNPSETASWAPGFLPTGSYEILVFYRQACEDSGPVPFTVNVTVDGQALPTVEGALTPPVQNADSVYITNFIVKEDGSAVSNVGGVYPDSSLTLLPAPANAIIAAAAPIQVDVPVAGSIYEEQDYLAYSFDAQANDLVSVTLTATSGSLDTLVQIIDANGALVDVNDDAPGTTDSQINSLRLVQGGTYYIIASRYGKEIGGSEGTFELLLSGPSVALPEEILALNLPSGDIEVIVTWPTSADVQLLVRDPIGDAVFDDQPNVNSGGILALDGNVNCRPPEGTPASYIYWPDGLLRPGIYEIEVWYQNTCNDTTPLQFTLAVRVNGQTVLVEQQTPQPNQRFVVSFTVNPDGTFVAGPGGYIDANSSVLNYQDQLPSAQQVSYGQSVFGTISPTNVFDLYSFQGTAGDVVTISMLATSQTLDTKIFLISPSGFELAENDDADSLLRPANARATDSLINAFTLPENGTYTVIATRFATLYGGTIGGYNLAVQSN